MAKLTVREVEKLIRVAAECRVFRLSIEGLELEFVATDGNIIPYSNPDLPVQSEHSSQEHGLDDSLLEELRVAQLMTDDPVAYEQEMIDSQI